MKHISFIEAEYIAHRLAAELIDYTAEPMPAFYARYPHKLESCLETPFQEFNGEELYPGLHRKAAALFYLVIKNHPFENGNKRMAVTLTLTLLFLNNQNLLMTTDELYQLALTVAIRSDELDTSVAILEGIFKRYSTPLSKKEN